MDYYQGVVAEYLRADRATFVNTECLIQLAPGAEPAKGQHWYCDVLAVNFRDETAYLCEVTYSRTLNPLLRRLQAWSLHWPGLRQAVVRDCSLPDDWKLHPWVFFPKDRQETFDKKLPAFVTCGDGIAMMPKPRVTHLEAVVPWAYRTWDRRGDAIEPEKATRLNTCDASGD